MEERIQKILAKSGLGSRRTCESFIAEGRVTVNNRVAKLGDKADSSKDHILLDGEPISSPENLVYIALYKPRGVLSAVVSPEAMQTVCDLVDIPQKVYPVGRLDVESEGLILLTNDGELTNRLTHPRYRHEKEYRVLVARHPDDAQLDTWRRGVTLSDGYKTAPAKVTYQRSMGKGSWLRVTLREGKKRQIRETGSILGLPVVKIIRIRIATLMLGDLKARQWRYLSAEEIKALKTNQPIKPKQKGRKSTKKR